MQSNLKNSKVRSKASCIALILFSSVCIAQTEVPDKAVRPGIQRPVARAPVCQ